MHRTAWWLRWLLAVALGGTLAGAATLAAFSSSTSNDGSSFQAGTVHVSDNDAGAAALSL
jgi:predicted ribosomally synthesized peptide with SipW-like signal peptide